LIHSDDDDDDGGDATLVTASANNSLSITPPGSPSVQQTTKKRRISVRGANRTRKADLAIKRILVSRQSGAKRSRRRTADATEKLRSTDEDDVDDGGKDHGSSNSFDVKIRFRGEIHRLTVTPSERLGPLADRFGAALSAGLQVGRVAFESQGNRFSRDLTVAAAGLSIASILQARFVFGPSVEI
jgi:hypothetical protein